MFRNFFTVLGIASLFAVFFFLASAVFPSLSLAQVPVFKIMTEDSSVKFSVKASVAINGTFDKWDATLTFASTDVTTGVLDIKIQAASVNTGINELRSTCLNRIVRESKPLALAVRM